MAWNTRSLWVDIDRIALCVHRPTARRSQLREVVARLHLPANSFFVVAARHIASGSVSTGQLEVLSRYESRTLVQLNLERHLELGLITSTKPGLFEPSTGFRDASRLVLDLQGVGATELWQGNENLGHLAELGRQIVDHAQHSAPVSTPAFDGQVADRSSTPASMAGRLLASVTELRYLRADLHAAALASEGLVGPRARALDRLWKGHASSVAAEDLQRLSRHGLAVNSDGVWRLTDQAKQARTRAEAKTGELTDAALGMLATDVVGAFGDGIADLGGEDPRPIEQR